MPATALRVNDEVRVKGTDAFNLEWLRSTYPSSWNHEKFLGVVEARSGDKWIVKFKDGESATLARGKITFLTRGAPPARVIIEEDSSSDEGA